MTVDPSVDADTPTISASKIGFVPQTFDPSSECDLGKIPEQITSMSEETLTQDMESFIQDKARSWKEILQQYHGQPYPLRLVI
jgi:4-hydroxy-3-polyprenylbenzoate decarboxylase